MINLGVVYLLLVNIILGGICYRIIKNHEPMECAVDVIGKLIFVPCLIVHIAVTVYCLTHLTLK